MRLLMITRKVDYRDASPAGFTYTWVKKIGEGLDKLYVVTWQEGNRGNLPKNIEMEFLSGNKVKKIFSLWIKLLKILPRVDGIFCHQNPEYTILVGLYARLFRKRLISWYTHKAVNWRRHLMEWFANKILTASDISFRQPLFPKKVIITGHGIDVDYFKPVVLSNSEESRGKFKIVSIGRISPAKDYETLIETIEILIKEKEINNLAVKIIGTPVLKNDQKYFENLEQIVKDKNLEDYIKFLGPVPHNQIISYYQNCQLFINLSQTGSVDKVVLEAMACQTLVLTSNEAFIDILEDKRLLFEPKNPQDLAQKIINLINLPQEEKEEIGQRLRKEVVDNHNLDKLVKKIISFYEK